MPFNSIPSSFYQRPFIAPLQGKSQPLMSAFALVSMMLSATCLSGCQKSPTTAIEAQTAASTPIASVTTSTNDVTTPSATSTTSVATASATLKPNVSQQFIGNNLVQERLRQALPEITYTTDNLPAFAQLVNQASWSTTSSTDSSANIASSPVASTSSTSISNAAASQPTAGFQTTIDYSALKQSADSNSNLNQHQSKSIVIKPDELLVLKIQALLNWHGHSVGPVNGTMNKNVIKAMQIFQQKHNLPITTTMNDETWAALTSNDTLNKQPVFINYQLTRDDLIVTSKPRDMQYKSAREAVAERFHMSQKLVSRLNPNTPLKAGNIITVYNPYQPNMTEVVKVVSDKKKNILYAYDAKGELVASYPTTVGSHYTPSPSGNLVVKNRVLNPTYNSDFSTKEKLLPPGPNNPVGKVWIGLSKRSFGIHGSPEPEMISSQKSHGCVRLTNWDALSLYGTIADGAEVIFL